MSIFDIGLGALALVGLVAIAAFVYAIRAARAWQKEWM